MLSLGLRLFLRRGNRGSVQLFVVAARFHADVHGRIASVLPVPAVVAVEWCDERAVSALLVTALPIARERVRRPIRPLAVHVEIDLASGNIPGKDIALAIAHPRLDLRA